MIFREFGDVTDSAIQDNYESGNERLLQINDIMCLVSTM